MKPLAIFLACSLLWSCGRDSSNSKAVTKDNAPQSLTRIITYQFGGDGTTEVLVTDFNGAANKTVTVSGKQVTVPVELQEFNYLWNAQDEVPIIKASLLGEAFSGIDTETHHIISYVTTGTTRTANMHAVPQSGVTPEFKEWLQRLLQTKRG